jgi:hypothetical protein
MLSDLGIVLSNFHVTPVADQLDTVEYRSTELGLKFTASKQGEVLDLKYFPAGSYDHLRCTLSTSENSETRAHGPSSILFGEYDPKSFRKSSALFADMVSKFNTDFSGTGRKPEELAQIWIVSYAGRRSRIGEASQSAKFAREYLMNQYQIDAARIKEIDGGFLENASVQLFIQPHGASPPTPHPTVHPKKVIIID